METVAPCCPSLPKTFQRTLDRRTASADNADGSLSFQVDFSSVNDFLKAARSAKQDQKERINDIIEPFMDHPGTVGITPALSEEIEKLFESYGDECLRSTAMFCIGKWLNVHRGVLEEHRKQGEMEGALFVMSDISKLALVLRTLEDISSFGGDDGWRQMLKKIVSQVVMELCEERGIKPEDYLS